MSDDKERIDAFMNRLMGDPDLSAIAVLLGPYRAMIRDASAMVDTIESLVAHWKATEPLETKT